MFQTVMLWFLTSFCLRKTEQNNKNKKMHTVNHNFFCHPKCRTFKCTLEIGGLIKQGISEAIINNDIYTPNNHWHKPTRCLHSQGTLSNFTVATLKSELSETEVDVNITPMILSTYTGRCGPQHDHYNISHFRNGPPRVTAASQVALDLVVSKTMLLMVPWKYKIACKLHASPGRSRYK